jgi:glycosyltransferase involved in cell wall biosynthesis
MRIAHITDCYLPRLGGIEMQVHDLARRQAAHHEVTIITTTGVAERVSSSLAPGGGFDVVRAAGPGRPEKIHYRSAAHGPRLVLAEPYDVVHVHASSFSPLAFLAARTASLSGIPTVATVHSLWAKATPLFSAADRLASWGDWPVAWSAVSNAAAASMRKILGARGRVAILPNGVDPSEWRVGPAALPKGELHIAVVCRLAPRKRPYQLVHILQRVRRELPAHIGVQVDIMGEGPERARIERYLRRHGMTSWVHLRGRVTRAEIRATYAKSNLFVAPAHLESFGIAALEARCAGLPILALAGTGVQDFVTHGREGWLVGSDRAMLETIVSLATSPALLERVAAHNRRAEPPISWSGVLRGSESLYRQAAALQGRPWPVDDTRAEEIAPVATDR